MGGTSGLLGGVLAPFLAQCGGSEWAGYMGGTSVLRGVPWCHFWPLLAIQECAWSAHGSERLPPVAIRLAASLFPRRRSAPTSTGERMRTPAASLVPRLGPSPTSTWEVVPPLIANGVAFRDAIQTG